MKKYFSREVIIGIITIISLFILYFGINYLKGVNLFKPSNHYYIKFDNVTDLQKSSPVYVDGFKVGVVNSIEYDYTKVGSIIAQINLDKKMKIQQGSYVELTSGLTTGASLHLRLNTYVSVYCEVGDTLNGNIKIGMMDYISGKVLPEIENMIPKIDSILTGLQYVVNHPALSQSLTYIEKTTSNLEKTTAQLNQVMRGDVPVILSNFKTISSELAAVSIELNSLDIEATYSSINKTLSDVEKLSEKLNSKDNNVGLLLNDRNLYDNLNTTIINASDLLQDIKKNPKNYVHFSIW